MIVLWSENLHSMLCNYSILRLLSQQLSRFRVSDWTRWCLSPDISKLQTMDTDQHIDRPSNKSCMKISKTNPGICCTVDHMVRESLFSCISRGVTQILYGQRRRYTIVETNLEMHQQEMADIGIIWQLNRMGSNEQWCGTESLVEWTVVV